MSKDSEIPSAFQQSLAEYYGGRLEPYCHQADELRAMALGAFKDDYFRYIPIARKLGEYKYWESQRSYNTQLNEQDVVYSLITDRHKRFLRDRRIIPGQAISLILNHEITLPAAIILPPQGDSRSASVIVGEHVNQPEHLAEIDPIIRYLGFKEHIS